jgi:hypothetical protein
LIESIGHNVDGLRKRVATQADEILQLRATIMGIVDLLQRKAGLNERELKDAVATAWDTLVPPPPPEPPRPSDPYRGMPVSDDEPDAPTDEEIAAATQLLRAAEEYHFAKLFAEARAIYRQIVELYGTTDQAAVASQQLENLRNVD